jgi:PAS domain S-box-containing protein
MLYNPDDIARMPVSELKKLLLDFQARQVEIQIQNETLQSALGCQEQLFNNSPAGFIMADEQGRIERINQTALQLLNENLEEVKGRKLESFIKPEDSVILETFLLSLTGALTPQIATLKLKKKSTEVVEIECRGSAHKDDDNRIKICMVVNDISSFKQAEDNLAAIVKQLEDSIQKKTASLSESNKILKKTVAELNHSKHQLLEREAKLNSILNASIEGIIVIDTAGTIVSVNAAVEKIFGYEGDELIGNRVDLLMPLNLNKKHQSYLEKYLRIFIPKAVGQIREVEGLRKDASLVPLDMTIAEFPLDGHQYYSGIVRDVTARKMQELQEKEHLEKLAHVTRLGLMGEMASGIAHEVNQPLSAVVNYTQVCLRFIENDNPDLAKIGEILHKANQQALKAGQIIHNMREFVKPRKIHRSTVDINELLYEAITIFEADFKQHLIAMRFEMTKNLPFVFIDRVQIEQVFLNLIRNSIDALKDLPQFTQRKLSVETSLNDASYIVVRVKDNGPGLTPLQKEKILTPFFTTKTSGMGMGLSISRSLVEAHHGTLHFNSKEDKGTTFYFTIPTEKAHNDRSKV